LVIFVVNMYCAFMLCYNNVCLQFTDMISCDVTREGTPMLIPDHEHAVYVRKTRPWIATISPVCIVQGCPIAPFPDFLFPAYMYHLNN
jgi:hypothetical protein